jgi:two-component system, NtrC family, response regulator AtoC
LIAKDPKENSMSARILVVDDEKLIRWSLRERLVEDGYQVEEAACVEEARQSLDSSEFDLALFDLRLPDGTGLDLLRHAQGRHPHIMVLIITAHSSVDSAVEAMKEGAFDYLSKPFHLDEISMTVKRALETQGLRKALSTEVQQKQRQFGVDSLIGESPAFQEVKEMVHRVAAAESSSVLLLGETGTGKDLFARAIHYESPRAAKPFMNITCTALPESLIESELFGHEKGAFTGATESKSGLFEMGHGGTVFLDEIGDMPPDLQAKLLRVLEERSFRRVGGTKDIHVDCRVIAATHRDLPAMVEEREFRQDLYYRLSTIPILLPPLRGREGDIRLLAQHFLNGFARAMGRPVSQLSPAALQRLAQHAWPGNIREMRNVMERAVLLATSDPLDADAFSFDAQAPHAANTPFALPPEGCSLADVERSLLEQAIARTSGNQTRAAALLGISRDQMRYKMEKNKLERTPNGTGE